MATNAMYYDNKAEGQATQVNGNMKIINIIINVTINAVNPQDVQRKNLFDHLDVEKMLKEETMKREDSPDKEYRTLLIMHALGCYFYEQKRYQEAETMHRRVIERRKKLLGSEHRDTQLSMIWLGHDLKAQDKGLDAYICFQTVKAQELRRLLKPYLELTKT